MLAIIYISFFFAFNGFNSFSSQFIQSIIELREDVNFFSLRTIIYRQANCFGSFNLVNDVQSKEKEQHRPNGNNLNETMAKCETQ